MQLVCSQLLEKNIHYTRTRHFQSKRIKKVGIERNFIEHNTTQRITHFQEDRKLLCIIKLVVVVVVSSLQKLPLEWKTNEKCISIHVLKATKVGVLSELQTEKEKVILQ